MSKQTKMFEDRREPQITYIPREQIRLPEQFDVRTLIDEESIHELGTDIRENGLLHPPHVRRVSARGSGPVYEVVAGKRRYLATAVAGLDPVPCIVHHEISEAQIEILAVHENYFREDPCELDVVRAVALVRQRRLRRGEPATNEAVGAVFLRVGSWVSERLTIYERLIDPGLIEQAGIEQHLLRQLTKDALKRAADQEEERDRIQVLIAAARQLDAQPERAPGKRARTRREHPNFMIKEHPHTGGVSIRLDPARMNEAEKAAARRELLPHLRELGFRIDTDGPDAIRQGDHVYPRAGEAAA